VLLECSSDEQVWCAVNLWDKIDSALRQDYNMDCVIFTLLKKLTPMESKHIAAILRSTWKHKKPETLKTY